MRPAWRGGEAVVEQQEVGETVMQMKVGQHPACTVRHCRGHQRLAVARLLVQHRLQRRLGDAAQLDVGGGNQLAGDRLAPSCRHMQQRVFVRAVFGLDAAEEAVARELVVALPLQAEAFGLEQHMAGGGGRRVLAELPGELGEMRGLAFGAALVVQEGEVGDEFRGVERNGRARMHLVTERLAQGMLFEQGGHGGLARRAAHRCARGRAGAPSGILAHASGH